MAARIARIAVGGYGNFSCYLIAVDDGFILVDTGTPPTREALEKGLAEAGCVPGKLRLVLLTNGLMDSSGNGAWVRRVFGAPTAVHALDAAIMTDSGGVEREWRSPAFAFLSRLTAPLARKVTALRESFPPDLCIGEDFGLSAYGWDARIVHVPGYSKGSIGILTPEGDFLSGNLVTNTWNQYVSPYVADSYAELYRSLDKILDLPITTVYPLCGPPFPMERLVSALGSARMRRLERMSRPIAERP
jgi:hydroxyacylglutathione hydrolase